MKLHVRLLIALVLGIVLGTALSPYAQGTWIAAVNTSLLRPIGQIFLRLIFMIVVPMVFSALVVGVYELGRRRGLSGVVGRTLLFTVVLSTASVAIGILLVNVIRPGTGLQLQTAAAQDAGRQARSNRTPPPRSRSPTRSSRSFPRNPIDSAARALDGEMLPLMVFALIFGVALSAGAPRGLEARGSGSSAGLLRTRSDLRTPSNLVVSFLEQVFEACMRIVEWVMRLAPFAVFAIVFGTALTFGVAVLRPLLLYVVTVVGGLLIQQFVVYADRCCGPWRGDRLSRSSARAARSISTRSRRPRRTRRCRCRWRRPNESSASRRRSAASCSRSGSTANQNGTALFEGVTVMFLAQAYGLDLTLGRSGARDGDVDRGRHRHRRRAGRFACRWSSSSRNRSACRRKAWRSSSASIDCSTCAERP